MFNLRNYRIILKIIYKLDLNGQKIPRTFKIIRNIIFIKFDFNSKQTTILVFSQLTMTGLGLL